jgi:preprotein translocase subunit SecE
MLLKWISFFNQVKQEFFKIIWTPKKQALYITGMVFVMVFITALYFFVLDFALSKIVNFFISLGS